ncbi:HAD domain-containing protein [Dyella japonica]|uniref:HAD domain-containing protein n=1 Tax=Dyella japonica TaxID=231455 RepID=UPI000379CF49|nr:HAD domain-containing protein [Dyella japonica]
MHTDCYILLDFDGVLHPKDGGPETYFVDLPAFEAVLREFPGVAVVIASSWRHTQTLDALRSYFSSDLRARIVDVTPDIPQAAGDTDRGTRHKEAMAWLERNAEPGMTWIAVDDMPHLYDPSALVVVTRDGFGDAEANALRAALVNPLALMQQRQASNSNN